MWRLIKLFVFLTVIAGAGLVGYAYLGPIFFPADFAPPVEQVIEPIILDAR